MSDDLDDLKAMMNAATPGPDVDRKAENIALAEKNFADLQGSRNGLRPTSDRPRYGLISGVRKMMHSLTSRAALTACTALVAVGIVVYSPIGEQLTQTTLSGQTDQSSTGVDVANGSRKVAPTANPAPTPEPLELREAEAALDDTAEPQTSIVVIEEALSAEADFAESNVGAIVASEAPAIPQARTRRQAGIAAADAIIPPVEPNTEAFSNAETNPLKITSEDPVSTFSIDVDTASYAVVRSSLTNGQLPPKDAVRVEEMVNYFPYDYPTAQGDAAFRPTVSVSQTPWNPDTQLIHIGIQGAEPDDNARPPLNLVFLIDTSGSMNQPDKLPLLKQSFRLMLGQLRPEDQIAIVAYAGSAGQVLAPTPASERQTILAALNNLGAGGSTAGQQGLQQAYATAETMAEDGEVSRVILATDGDFNVGLSDPEALKDFIAEKRKSGTYLSVLGFGRGNLDDATMQALAQNGNGQAAYIDTLSEAQKVLVDQLGGALYPIADDVKIQVEFNPARVAEYRLIGYETRSLRREDFNNDAVDAGDIGAGHQVTALYEITPVGSPAQLSDPLRYGQSAASEISDELGFLRLRTKAPGASTSTLIETPITADLPSQNDAGFAIAVAGFGQLLRGTTYLGDWSYGDAIALALDSRGADPYGYRAEAIQLMRLAQSLSAR